MIDKDKHIALLKKQVNFLFILFCISFIGNISTTMEIISLEKKLNKAYYGLGIADSINTINTQYMAGIQAQFDSTTKHIRPYEKK
jgi:hypothetical protein